jgi:hypothetical protein
MVPALRNVTHFASPNNSNHPESNSAVERLHRRLKDALCACAAAATWAEELPFVLLSLCAQPREDTGLSPAEAVFGTQIVLPNELLQGDEFSVDPIVKNLKKLWMLLLFLCPGTIPVPSCQPSGCTPPSSGSAAASLSRLSTATTTALRHLAARTPLLHHQGRVAGRDRLRQPPQGLH